jgi:RND family efflux transporter MFP subunit
MSRKRKVTFLGGGILVAGAIVLSVTQMGMVAAGTGNERIESTVLRPVPTAVVKECSSNITRTFPGTVRAAQRVELAFERDGLLVELNAREGRIVSKGDVIARLDTRDTQNNLDAAKAAFDDAARNYERAKALRKQKVIAQAEFDSALSAWEIAGAKYRVCEKTLSDTQLTAPFDGVIAARHVESHERLNARQAVVSFQDISRVEVVIQMPERLIAHGSVKALRNIKVRFDADGDRLFDAVAQEYRVQPDATTKTYDVVVSLAPPSDIAILPGMTASVKVEMNNPDKTVSDWTQQAMEIPAEAIWSDGHGESYVWIVPNHGGKAKKTKVDVGRLANETAFITSGLKPGEYVAVAGLHTLGGSLLVRPRLAGKDGLDG